MTSLIKCDNHKKQSLQVNKVNLMNGNTLSLLLYTLNYKFLSSQEEAKLFQNLNYRVDKIHDLLKSGNYNKAMALLFSTSETDLLGSESKIKTDRYLLSVFETIAKFYENRDLTIEDESVKKVIRIAISVASGSNRPDSYTLKVILNNSKDDGSNESATITFSSEPTKS